MNPYHYTVFCRVGYMPMAKVKGKQIKGILVVRQNSPIKTIGELADDKLAFPSPGAFAASMIPRAVLSDQKIAANLKYVGPHDSGYRAVAKGFFVASGGVRRTFSALDPKIAVQLRVLWTSSGYTPHALVCHRRVSTEVRQASSKAMLAIHRSPAGKKLLQGLRMKPFEVARDKDWNDVRSLEITDLDHLVKAKPKLKPSPSPAPIKGKGR